MNLEDVAVTVKDVNEYIKKVIDNDENLSNLVVKGEISNFKRHYTGHLYFTLKDNDSLIKCICFKGYAQNLQEDLKDGDKVFVVGSVNVFSRDGVYQLYARDIKKTGMGGLYQKFLELKASLEKEGLFNPAHKQKIPKYPNTIGVLTSQTGSVIRDIINVATRRNPNVNIRLIPVPVQGPDAHLKIVKAIEYANNHDLADTLILARGGGSLEDLWPFNEQDVAYAIYNSKIPIISSVGHETDFTIADFVSDLRAPTPSAAAELAVPDVLELRRRIEQDENKLKNTLLKKLEIMNLKYSRLENSIVFKNPYRILEEDFNKLDYLNEKLAINIKNEISKKENNLNNLIGKIEALSPLKTLERGFCIAQIDGKVVNKISQINKDDNIELKLLDGKAKAKVEQTQKY